MASATFDEHAEERRPTVQVGDPFTEKLLLEACLEAMATRRGRRHPGHGRRGPGVLHLRDAGAQRHRDGRRAVSGAAAREGMTPYELLLSESQERMLLVAARGREERRAAGLREVGAGRRRDRRGDRRPATWWSAIGATRSARVPVEALAEAPIYEKPYARAGVARRAARLRSADAARAGRLRRGPGRRCSASPTIASKEWAFRQYDQQVGINTLVLPGSDAAVLRVKGTRRALAVVHRRQRASGLPRSAPRRRHGRVRGGAQRVVRRRPAPRA